MWSSTGGNRECGNAIITANAAAAPATVCCLCAFRVRHWFRLGRQNSHEKQQARRPATVKSPSRGARRSLGTESVCGGATLGWQIAAARLSRMAGALDIFVTGPHWLSCKSLILRNVPADLVFV